MSKSQKPYSLTEMRQEGPPIEMSRIWSTLRRLSETERELERLRAELEQAHRMERAFHEGEHVDHVHEASAEVLKLRVELEQVKRERLHLVEAEKKACTGMLSEQHKRIIAEKERDSARADNARLREALSPYHGGVRRCECDDLEEGLWCAPCQQLKAALASTDPSPWLRDFGMKVAFALEGVPVTRERRDQIAAIVAGVMK